MQTHSVSMPENVVKRSDSIGKAAGGKCELVRVSQRWELAILLLLFSLALSVFFSCSPLCAQTHDGSLSGAVKNPSGIPLQDVYVVIKNTANNEVKTMVVDRDGSFSVRNLAPGTYEITASKQGF